MTFEEFKTTVRAELILAGLEIDKLPKIENLETMYKGKLTIKESATISTIPVKKLFTIFI